MPPVCFLNRTKNLHQSDELHFISDSLECRDDGTFILFVDEVFDGIGVQHFKERLDLQLQQWEYSACVLQQQQYAPCADQR